MKIGKLSFGKRNNKTKDFKWSVKTASENTCNKIKAIYPHITVSGDVDNPYYNIDWYDIEKQTMYRGYSSYKLELVRKWLQEEFEVVEEDIDDLINRQKAENLSLQNKVGLLEQAKKMLKEDSDKSRESAMEVIRKQEAEIERLITSYPKTLESIKKIYDTAKAEAVKEFAERLKKCKHECGCNYRKKPVYAVTEEKIDETYKEMVGEG